MRKWIDLVLIFLHLFFEFWDLLDPVKTRLRDVTKIVNEKQRLWEIRLWDNFKLLYYFLS